MEGYRPFRKDRLWRWGGGVAPYINDQLDYLGIEEELPESLWVRIKERTGTKDIIVGSAAGHLPRNTEWMRPVKYRLVQPHVQKPWPSSETSTTSRNNTVGNKQSRKLLECDNNFLFQVIEEATRMGAVLGLVLTNRERLVGHMKLEGSNGCHVLLFHSPTGMPVSLDTYVEEFYGTQKECFMKLK